MTEARSSGKQNLLYSLNFTQKIEPKIHQGLTPYITCITASLSYGLTWVSRLTEVNYWVTRLIGILNKNMAIIWTIKCGAEMFERSRSPPLTRVMLSALSPRPGRKSRHECPVANLVYCTKRPDSHNAQSRTSHIVTFSRLTTIETPMFPDLSKPRQKPRQLPRHKPRHKLRAGDGILIEAQELSLPRALISATTSAARDYLNIGAWKVWLRSNDVTNRRDEGRERISAGYAQADANEEQVISHLTFFVPPRVEGLTKQLPVAIRKRQFMTDHALGAKRELKIG